MSDMRKPHVIVLRTAAVLLILVMLSISMVAGRYARYTTTATASDSARAAKYHIAIDPGADDSITLSPDSPASYTFSVTSSSEVAVEYDLRILLPQALPDGIEISLTRDATAIALTSESNQYTAVNAGTFSPQGGTHTYTLTFAATKPIGAETMSGISIGVDARQVD